MGHVIDVQQQYVHNNKRVKRHKDCIVIRNVLLYCKRYKRKHFFNLQCHILQNYAECQRRFGLADICVDKEREFFHVSVCVQNRIYLYRLVNIQQRHKRRFDVKADRQQHVLRDMERYRCADRLHQHLEQC